MVVKVVKVRVSDLQHSEYKQILIMWLGEAGTRTRTKERTFLVLVLVSSSQGFFVTTETFREKQMVKKPEPKTSKSPVTMSVSNNVTFTTSSCDIYLFIYFSK